MPTKNTTVDADTHDFYMSADLSIDPPLNDAVIASLRGEYLTLKSIKDENVVVVDGQMQIVSTNITGVAAIDDAGTELANYPGLKTRVAAIASVAKTNGSKMNGHVFIHDNDNGRFFRLRVVDNVVTVEAAELGWPDGTRTPFPERH